MSKITIGSMVKINPSIFGDDCKPDSMYGALGYVGVLKNAVWKVDELIKDNYRGECAWATLTNANELIRDMKGVKSVKSEGRALIILADLVLANTKVTLDYIITSTLKSRAEMIADLFEDRRLLKLQGKSRSDVDMMDNWRKIRVLRGELKGEMPVLGEASVYLPKQKMKFQINPMDLPDESEDSIKKFKILLTSKIRSTRNERKIFNSQTVNCFGKYLNKIGGVFHVAGELLQSYELSLRSSLDDIKKPTDADATYVGVEVEFIYSGDNDALKNQLIKNRLHKNVRVEGDGSLRACHNSGYSTAELQIIAKTTELESVMNRLQKVMDNPLIDGYANRSCGTHVHLDMRKRDHVKVFKNLVRIQDILRGSQPIGRLKNTHCKPNKTDEFGAEGNRYLVVNPNSYAKHTTVEVRIHEGTVDAQSIINWVKFLDAIASLNIEIPVNKFKTTKELVSATNIEIPSSSMNYIDSRIEKFQSLSVG